MEQSPSSEASSRSPCQETEGPLPRSQESASGPYPEADGFSAHLSKLFL